MLVEIGKQNDAQRELKMGENLLWLGKPDPVRSMIEGYVLWIFAIPWTIFSLSWVWGTAGPGMGRSLPTPGFNMEFFSVLGEIPFVLVGPILLASPFFLYAEAKRTIYAITDRRVLIIETGGTRKIQSYSARDLSNIQRTERADRSGDLIFAQEDFKDSDGDMQRRDIKFCGIPEVRSVENLLRDTFKKKEF
jgi:hypothetical protein